MLVNRLQVQAMQRMLNTAGLENILKTIGYDVDLQVLIEERLRNNYPADYQSIGSFIANNYDYFIHGDSEEVTRKLNQYLNTNPVCFEFMGYRYCYDNTLEAKRKLFTGIAVLGGALILMKSLSK